MGIFVTLFHNNLLLLILTIFSFIHFVSFFSIRRLNKYILYVFALLISIVLYSILIFAPNVILKYFLFSFIGFFGLLISFKLTIERAVFFVIFLAFHHISIDLIIKGTLSLITLKNITIIVESEFWKEITSTIVLYFFLVIIQVMSCKKFKQKLAHLFHYRDQLRILIGIHMNMLLLLLLNTSNLYYNLDYIWLSIFPIVMSTTLLFVYYITIYYSIRLLDFIKQQRFYKQQKKQMVNQLTYLNNVSNNRILKETAIELNTAVNYLLSKKRIEESQKVLSEGINKIISQIPESNNKSNIEEIDALFFTYSLRCKQNSIQFTTYLFIPKEIPFTVQNLYTMLTVLLENAIEANQNITKDRFIKINYVIEDNWFKISIINPYKGEIIIKDGLPVNLLDTEHKEMMGLQFIRDILGRNKGTLVLKTDNSKKEFQANLLIPLYLKNTI